MKKSEQQIFMKQNIKVLCLDSCILIQFKKK